MPRQPTLVQLNDELLALLDERAVAAGVSRSALIRTAIESYLAEDRAAAIDAAIVEGYTRLPQTADELRWAEAAGRRSIADEAW